VRKLFTANKYLPIALALAAFASAGTVPAFAQSAGTWSAGISARNRQPYLHAPSTNDNGYSSYAQAPSGGQFAHRPSTNRRGYSAYGLVPDYSATAPSSLGPTDRFGIGTQS
jgi:hypothetical protein